MTRLLSAIIALSAIIFALPCPGRAQERRPASHPAPKLLLVVLDQVTWHDLLDEQLDAPTLQGLMRKSGLGMMCARTARGRGGGYLTIGAGSRASSGVLSDTALPVSGMPAEGYALQANETHLGPGPRGLPARHLFTLYTGWPPADNAIVHLGIGELLRENSSASYPLRLGLLGGTLRRAGLHIACVGNADTPGFPHRELVAIAMDEQGLVESGDVSAALSRRDPSLPSGYATDGRRLLAAFHRVARPAGPPPRPSGLGAARSADVVVLDLGETSRAAAYAELMAPGAAQAARRSAIERADRLLGSVLASLSSEDWAVLVISPTVRQPDPEEESAPLAPIIFFVPGGPPGLLSSPSTRRAGLVVNTDIAPTVLGYFDLELPAEVIGRPITCLPVSDGAQPLARLEADLARQDAAESARQYAFRALPLLATIVLAITALLLPFGERAPRAARGLLRGLLLFLLAAPAVMLLVALPPLSAPYLLAAVIGGSLVVALLGHGLTTRQSGHLLPALALVMLLIYDLARGQQMLYWSPFSYSPAAGARFYGIGNEYGGALLGAALIAPSGLLSSRPHPSSWAERIVAIPLLGGIVVLVAAPGFGANLGMAVGCAAGFAVFLLYLWRERPTASHLIVALTLAFAIAAAAIAADIIIRGPESSHLGRWYSSLHSQGWQAAADVFQRKWAMNWLLTRASRWTSVALAALAVYVLAALARPRAVVATWQDRPWLAPALTSCLVGAAVSWLANDSGIVAAALALIYGAGSLGYLGLGEAPTALEPQGRQPG